ncbi:MAG: aminomethyl-transferring glycine dehydrogenase subunit GcvPA [Chitinispirillales bacterium]|jgi:glycine dehydrogenase subunit 1|nr:aminomethyl-transferring glycine dehydrogenase subunit GcvPA [Chitinispirillales bacterium]
MSYVSITPEQRQEMLRVCGVSAIGELFADVPASLAPPADEFWETGGLSELEVLAECERLTSKNHTAAMTSFLGGGFYDHYIPAAIDAITSRSEFYTSYTPYQPELSQGTLQAIYEYQSQICRLTGMEISNASLYDGGTAIFEACNMAAAHTSRRKIVVDKGVNPIYRKMLRAHSAGLDIEIVEIPVLGGGSLDRGGFAGAVDDSAAAVVLQNPNFFGIVDDHSDIVDKCKEKGVMTIQSVYPVALALIKTPAEQGFDIAVGEGQSLGIPLSFGGPYLGFIGTKKTLVRRMPGRIAARAEDVNGKPGFVLSLQAREQHIRREKATSNICTNSALCALRAHIYLSLIGKEGLTEVASLCHNKAIYARERIGSVPGVKVSKQPIFNEFLVELPMGALECVRALAGVGGGFAAGIPAGLFGGDCFGAGVNTDNMLIVAVTEKRTKEEIDSFVDNLAQVIKL